MEKNYDKFFENLFDGYVILDTGYQALRAYLSSIKGGHSQKIKNLLLIKEIADEKVLSKVIDKSKVDELVDEVILRLKNSKKKQKIIKQTKFTSFNDVLIKPINSFEDELLKCQYILENSIIYIDSITSEKNDQTIFSEIEEKTHLYQKNYNLLRNFLKNSEKYKNSDIIFDIGNLQGTEGDVEIFGMLLKTDARNFQLEDTNMRIALDISGIKKWGNGYFTHGCCVVCRGYHKNDKLFAKEIRHPDLIWNYQTFEEKYEKDFFGAITKAFKLNERSENNSGNNSKSSKNFGGIINNNYDNIPLSMFNLLKHDISDNKILYPKTIDIKSKINNGVQIIKDYFNDTNKINKLFLESKNILKNQFFLVLSNVNLSDNRVINAIDELIKKYSSNNVALPFMIIFMGNFFKDQSFNNFKIISDGFEQLEKILLKNKGLVDSTYFVFIPGPDDFCLHNSFPKFPFIPSIIEKMKEKIPNIINATNPCRFSFFGKEIVIFRDDLNKKISTNSIYNIKEEEKKEEIEEKNNQIDIFIETILRQGNLSPVPIKVSSKIWHLSYKMLITPLPDILILGDITSNFSKKYSDTEINNDNEDVDMEKKIKFKETIVVNPGDFSKDTFFALINPINMESNIYSLK